MNYVYRTKVVEIQAFQMTEDRRSTNRDWPDWLNAAWQKDANTTGAVWGKKHPHSDGKDELVIGTLEGNHNVSWGDFIIQGLKGELYPCKPDIFFMKYEATAGADPDETQVRQST